VADINDIDEDEYVPPVANSIEALHELLIHADGFAVSQCDKGLADMFSPDCAWAQETLRTAGCWPRGSDHRTPGAPA
jgi:hypothetical protein